MAEPDPAPPLTQAPDEVVLQARLASLRAALGAWRLGVARRLVLPGASAQPFAILGAVDEQGPLRPAETALPLGSFKLLLDTGAHLVVEPGSTHTLAPWLLAHGGCKLRGWPLPNDRLACVAFVALFAPDRDPGAGRLRVAEQGMEALARALAPPPWLLLPHGVRAAAATGAGEGSSATAMIPTGRSVCRLPPVPHPASRTRRRKGRTLHAQPPGEPGGAGAIAGGALILTGGSAAAEELRRRTRAAALTHDPVLLQGEAGSGFEELARCIHGHSPRAAGPFVVVRCAGSRARALEREMFGAAHGTRRRAPAAGLLELAHSGTLLVEDAEALSRPLQSRLIQALRSGELRHAGRPQRCGLDVRLVLATRGDLREQTRRGRFLEQLYWYVAGSALQLPPLRARAADVPGLLRALVRAAICSQEALVEIEVAAETALRRCGWPGNFVQLREEAARLATLHGACATLRTEMLSPAVREAPAQAGLDELDHLIPLARAHALVEAHMIRRALRCMEGNKAAAAKALGLSRQGLYRKLRRHNLDSRQPERRSL